MFETSLSVTLNSNPESMWCVRTYVANRDECKMSVHGLGEVLGAGWRHVVGIAEGRLPYLTGPMTVEKESTECFCCPSEIKNIHGFQVLKYLVAGYVTRHDARQRCEPHLDHHVDRKVNETLLIDPPVWVGVALGTPFLHDE